MQCKPKGFIGLHFLFLGGKIMETQNILSQFYENYEEDGRLSSRYGMVEYLTTIRYIEKYLRPGMRILEIGAATGRYSHALARQGYRVDAVGLWSIILRSSSRTHNPAKILPLPKGMRRVSPLLRTIPTI